MPAQGQLFAEEINCVYTRQNCTCEFNCPCEVNGEDSHEALWCGCEQLYNCTCEMRSGACTLGPPDDAYLYFPGTLNGTGGYLAGLRGEAMDFAPNASYTIEAWVRPYKQSADVPQTLVSRFNNQVSGQWIVYMDAAKRLCFQRATRTQEKRYGITTGVTGQMPPLCSAAALPKGAWTHVAAVYRLSNRSRMLLLNGSVVNADEQAADSQFDGETPLLVGAHLDQHMPAGLFHGEIDDIRVWTQARTQPEVAAYRSYRLTGYFPALQAYWRMDEGRGSYIPDMSGRGHELEMRGAMEWRYVPKLFGGEGDRHTGYIRGPYMAQEVPLGVVPRGESVQAQVITVAPGHNSWGDD